MFRLNALNMILAMALIFFLNSSRAQETAITSAGGGEAGSTNYRLLGIIGQSSPAGIASGSQYSLLSGFMYALNTNAFSNSAASFSLSPGTEQKNYRLVSVPAVLADPNPGKVLSDDLGEYNKKEWRLFDCTDGKKIDVEYPKTRDFKPGVALCLITKDKSNIDVENGSLIEAPTFTINLTKGWNLIGNPFNFKVPIGNLSLSSNPDADIVLWEYKAGWKKVTELAPWQGYAVSVTDVSTLVVNSMAPATSLRKETITPLAENEWQIQISAKSGELHDEDNIAGVRQEARLGNDAFDEFEPPPLGDYLSLSFPHPEWNTFLTDLASDIQPSTAEGWIWSLKIQSNFSDRVVLTFSGIERVTDIFKIFLIDPTTKIATDLRENNHLEVGANSSEKGRIFHLVVGNTSYTDGQISPYQTLPTQYALHQNFPNPFNPSTSIVFELPKADHVTLVIKNILGQEVAALARDQLYNAGRHVLIWNACNSLGHHVGSGTYFYEIRTEEWSEMRKMLLMQ